MSAQPNRNRPAPLNQRSQSQNNTLAIRVVPYTPPRIQPDGLAAGQQPSPLRHATGGSYGVCDDDQPSNGENASRAREGGGGKERHANPPGFALSSASSPALPLVGPDDEGVSGSSDDALRPLPSPVLVSPSELGRRTTTDPALHNPLPHPRPLSRNRNFVAIHSDKTFSLVPRGTQSNSPRRSVISPPLSYSSRGSSSNDRPSIGTWSEGRPSSPLTSTSATIPDRSLSPSSPSPSSSTTQLAEDPITSSPWNYRMLGGLRKVPKTPDLKQKTKRRPTSPTSDSPLSPLPEIPTSSQEIDTASRSVVPRPSFASTQTRSTTSETTNYKVYGHSPAPISSDSLDPPSSNNSNYEILGESSPPAPLSSSPPGSSDSSNENYVLHGDPSPSPSQSLVAVTRKPRPTYSQESLIVPPLRPAKKISYEDFGYYKQRSRAKLRARAGSVKTITSIKSISSVISQEAAQSFLAAPILLNLQGASSSHSTPGDSITQLQTKDSWEALPPAVGSSDGQSSSPSPSISPPQRIQMIQSHPHLWSSQLSTVMSESDPESSHGHSRSASYNSTGHVAGHRRRSSAGWGGSMHSRQPQSMSSASPTPLDEGPEDAGSISQSGSIERPHPAYARAGPSGLRMVRDQDEHGDGLADLREMSQHPSRFGLSGFFGSSDSSGRNIHSSGSSRANSLNSGLIPAWARVYYGSGERRFLGPSSASASDAGDSRPGSSGFHTGGSPNTDHFPLPIYTSRRRANHVVPPADHRPFSDSAEMDITTVPHEDYGIFRTLKRKTSSIWSPHLRADRRAGGYSVWDPPSVSWSADNGLLGKRNVQVVLFIIGFIFPFAWIIAAFLPLPPNPKHQMLEASQTQSRFGPVDYTHQLRLMGETRYESARWWRNLNRVMSVMGLVIIGAIAALVVLGLQQGWALRTST